MYAWNKNIKYNVLNIKKKVYIINENCDIMDVYINCKNNLF